MVDPFYAICCQFETKNCYKKNEIAAQAKRMMDMIDYAIEDCASTEKMCGTFPTRLIVFPELAMQGFAYFTQKEMMEKIAVEIPSEYTDMFAEKATQYKTYIIPGSWVEKDPQWPFFFNTMPLIGPKGYIMKYRKVNPWIPVEISCSPHDLLETGYKDPLFPVAKTEIGNIGMLNCWDGCFPEVSRELASNGAEILVRSSAFMDPWGDYWDIFNRTRAMENLAYLVGCNQGATVKTFPPFSWRGHSMIVDFEGRILNEAERGEAFVGAPIYIDNLRQARKQFAQKNCFFQIRSEAYTYLKKRWYPKRTEFAKRKDLTFQESLKMVKQAIEKQYNQYYKRK